MAKIIHYRSGCIGCGSCVELDKENWEMDSKDGKSNLKCGKLKKEVFIKDISEFEEEDAKKAAESCPVNVIKVVD